MDKKLSQKLKILLILFVVFLFAVTPNISNADNDGDDYDIPFVEKIIQIHGNGLVNITEDFNYTFRDTFNVVSRDIPLSEGQYANNISVETPGLYNNFTVTNTSGGVHIKVSLYKDEARTKGVANQSANIIYHYDYHKGLKMYNDVAEFKFLSWDNQWDKDVVRMTTYIKVPANKTNVLAYDNPPFYRSSNSWITPNTLETRYTTIEAHNSLEQRLLIPKTQFNSTTDADVINQDAMDIIIQNQTEYQDKIDYNYFITYVVIIVSIILMLTPLGIYQIYGREPDIEYSTSFAADIPTNDKPVFINAIVNGDVGQINIDAFHAAILDLIDRKYFKVIFTQDNGTIIKTTNQNKSNLCKYELKIIQYFSKYENENGHILFEEIKKTENSLEFQKFLKDWNSSALDSLDKNRISGYFHSKGSILFKAYTALTAAFVIMALFSVLTLEPAVPTIDWAFRATIVLIPIAILTVFLPKNVANQWTKEGKKFYDSWKHFEKYLTEYSLIKEYPPVSIQTWGKYLIYATALGCAKTACANMENYFKEMDIPKETISKVDVVLFAYTENLSLMPDTLGMFDTK